LITVLIGFVASGMNLTSDGATVLQILMLLGFLVGVMISSVQSSRANKLKGAAGITWPPQ
jgi:xanthosine utilization system XapX-like protein